MLTCPPILGSIRMRSHLFLAACLFSLAAAAGDAPHGISPGDVNRKGDACNDFFDYANGAWRKENPIPDYMDRWSRRWQSGELNKEHVRSILDEVSARRDWPAGSAEQLSGDFFGACMDEGRVNAAGLAPARPVLDEIAAIQSRADVERLIGRLHAIGVGVGFGIASSPDLHEPTQMVADIFASGLGLPDRDYYLKPDDRFVEARAKYREHVAKMFALAGSSPESADAAAASVFELEKRFAEVTLDNVASRDPLQQDHETSFDGLAGMAPAFDWARYFDGAKLPRIDLNVSEPKFLEAFSRELTRAPIEQWRNYLTWHVLNAFADGLSEPFVEQNFAFY